MKRIFLIVGLVLLVLKPSFAGPGPGPVSLQNCQEIYDKLDTMRECPQGKGPGECVGFDVGLVFVPGSGGLPSFCKLSGGTFDLPIDQATDDDVLVNKNDLTQIILTEEMKVVLTALSFSTKIYDTSDWPNYEEFILSRHFTAPNVVVPYTIYFKTITCGEGACPETKSDTQTTSGGDVPDSVGSGLGDMTADLGPSPPGAGSDTSNQSSQTEGGTLTGCYQISPAVPYHFSIEWFGLLGLLWVCLRRKFI